MYSIKHFFNALKNFLNLIVLRYAGEDPNSDLLTDYSDHLNATIMKTFDINLEQAARLQMELRQCVRKKNLVTFLTKLRKFS